MPFSFAHFAKGMKPKISTLDSDETIGLILACEQALGEILINFCALRLALLTECFIPYSLGARSQVHSLFSQSALSYWARVLAIALIRVCKWDLIIFFLNFASASRQSVVKSCDEVKRGGQNSSSQNSGKHPNDKYIYLIKCEGRAGRISVRGVDSAKSIQNRSRADIPPRTVEWSRLT